MKGAVHGDATITESAPKTTLLILGVIFVLKLGDDPREIFPRYHPN